jgi:hypothetical protein
MAEKKQAPDQFAEDIRKDSQALQTRDELRRQDQVPVYLQWTEDDEKNAQAGKALPYPRVEGVNINGVQYYLTRGEMRQVPVSVAVVLANAGKIPWSMVPDCDDKERYLADLAELKREREARYAGIGEGLVR